MAHDHHHTNNKKVLLSALVLISILVIAEVIGGLLTNSLALLADAAHMLSDFFAIGIALIAFKVGERAASKSKTFGYKRFEILAALINAVLLIGISVFVLWNAIQRFQEPPEVAGGGVLVFGSFAIIINLLIAWIMMRGGDVKGNINLKGAFMHVLGDLIGTVGVLISGILILLFNWTIADPIISVVVSLLILTAGFRVAKDSLHVLMEGKPPSISLQKIENRLNEIKNVRSIHDLHLWSITSDFPAFSCHLVVEDGADRDEVLQKSSTMLKEEFHISHASIQIEGDDADCTTRC
ncbi:cation diffusion facilitator family transporter [Salicibibacter kimchii]|uniref:Cation transporter n=1 Tax=Salicibibacter kimchii TaxID=2099786 RepID=A0A345BWV8_9BACI|nr:cation diffusion facilitator family transporter [Salicibibacter kimchii]AXF55439.1 cation transporter [Salicibibacter kimchii]